MGKSGRFGKYGEVKRKERLKQVPREQAGPGRTEGDSASGSFSRSVEVHPQGRVSVRSAELSDAAFIRDLSQKAFRQYGPYEELLPDWFLSGVGVAFVGIVKKRTAGYAMLGRIGFPAMRPRVSELLAIAVEPWAQKQGVGDRLMREIIHQARELFVERLVLHTAVDNLAGQAVFRKHGFVTAGVKPGFYPEGQTAVMMQKEIKPSASP